jgi:hypothetical protein
MRRSVALTDALSVTAAFLIAHVLRTGSSLTPITWFGWE